MRKRISTVPSSAARLASAALLGLLLASAAQAGMSVAHKLALQRAHETRLIYREMPEGNWEGYLEAREPVPMRFSDEEATRKRPPSPALPEFSVLSRGAPLYLVDKPLPDDQIRARQMLSEVAIELEPFTTVAGVIDPEIVARPKTRTITIDEETARPAALRPEEVLIFFETSNNVGGSTTAVVPFTPANPVPTIRSSAEYNKQ